MGTMARVTGPVLRTDFREGVSKASGKPYRLDFATVLVADQGVAEVSVPAEVAARLSRGVLVDFVVEASVFGNDAKLRFVEGWPQEPRAGHAG